jgi:hypothetical protein
MAAIGRTMALGDPDVPPSAAGIGALFVVRLA